MREVCGHRRRVDADDVLRARTAGVAADAQSSAGPSD